MDQLLDFFLHLETHLEAFVGAYGMLVYGLLFLIIFCETGLVVTPFLPGDSLLFTCGALAATYPAGSDTPILDIRLVLLLLGVAAVLGDAVNYSIGHFVGPRVFRAADRRSFWHRVLNREHLMKAHSFFERHGGKAIVLARFVPIVRTFVPFVAGAGTMSYPQFAFYNVGGALLWVGLCVGAGYGFGNVPVVKENFEIVIVAIVFISVLPIAWGYLISRLARKPVKGAAAD
jgi:membrane-associated protein